MVRASKTILNTEAGTKGETDRRTRTSSATKTVKKATGKEKKEPVKKATAKKTIEKKIPAVKIGTPKKATAKTAAAKTKASAGTVKRTAAAKTAAAKAPEKKMPVKKAAKNLAMEVMVDAMYEKKAQQVVSLDFATIDAAICDYFVIANADSTTQVSAIADSVEEQMFKKMKQWPIRCQGRENNFWIIMDYGDIVVHVFQTEYRKFYRLEELWADAKTTWHNEE